MSVDELLQRIALERKQLKEEKYSNAGLLRLQEAMVNYDGEYRLVWSDDLIRELADKPKSTLHLSGVKVLDDAFDGFREQQLITIGGDTGHGKTSFGLFLVEKYAYLKPLVIPLEQSNEELVQQRLERGHSVPKFLSPRALAARVTVEWIEERVVEGIAKHDSRLVLIDHLGYINDFGDKDSFRRENTAYRIGQVMKGLKNVAKKWNVIILLLVHISQHDEGKPPSRVDIKNSSDIAQESDMVMFVWRKNTEKRKVRVYENKTMLSIQKNRRTGKNATIGLEYDPMTGQFLESQEWVESLMRAAESEVSADDFV